MVTDREAAFRRAALLVKELGSSPWRDWDFTLRLADWLIASDSAPGPAPIPHPDQQQRLLYEWRDEEGRLLRREIAPYEASPCLSDFVWVGEDRGAATMTVRRGDGSTIIEYAREASDGVG